MNITFIISNYIDILKNKEFLQCIIINAIYLVVLFSYLTVAPFIYHAAGYTANEIGLTFIPIAFLLASQLIRFLQKHLNMTQFVLLAFILILCGLSVMVIPAFNHTIGLTPMIIGMSIAVFGMGFSNPVAFGKGVTLFPERSGSASSLLTALPFIASTLLTIIVHPICGTHIGLLVLFLATISAICVGSYFLLEIKK